MIVSPDGKHVYTGGDGDNGSGSIIEATILGFTRNIDGTLTQSSKIQGKDITAAFESIVNTRFTFSPDSNFLCLISSNTDNLFVFQRSSVMGELSLIKSTSTIQFPKTIIDSIDNAHGITVSPDGNNLHIVANASDTSSNDSVVIFSRAPDGSLTYQTTIYYLDNGADILFDPSRITINPSGKLLYISSDIAETISIFNRNAETGL